MSTTCPVRWQSFRNDALQRVNGTFGRLSKGVKLKDLNITIYELLDQAEQAVEARPDIGLEDAYHVSPSCARLGAVAFSISIPLTYIPTQYYRPHHPPRKNHYPSCTPCRPWRACCMKELSMWRGHQWTSLQKPRLLKSGNMTKSEIGFSKRQKRSYYALS
jgi:hypothetical protein